MKYETHDEFGQLVVDTRTIFNWLYDKPELDLAGLLVLDPEQYNSSVDQLHVALPKLAKYVKPEISVEEFDQTNQSIWYMPQEYQDLDIAKWLLDQCTQDYQLQRVGQELLMYQERNLFPLLCYLKYLVDTMRQHGVVWGVGRGSSVASYVLYLIGIHRIDSIKYDLDIQEFLKD